jgi:hypothetical protein
MKGIEQRVIVKRLAQESDGSLGCSGKPGMVVRCMIF